MTYRGGTFRSQGDVHVAGSLDTFAVTTSLYGQVDKRARERSLKLTFIPDGEWSNLGVLWPYAATPFGTFITPQLQFGAISSNQVNVGSTANNLMSGDAFVAQVQGSGTITNGIVAGTTYYLHIISSTNISIHSTYANAVAGINPLTISAGSGTTQAIVNNPLTIQTLDGDLWTFNNAAVTRMPNLSLSTVRTAMRECEFEAFASDGTDWSVVNSLYTYASNPWPGDTGFNPTNILVGEIQAIWRNMAAPWALFDTKEGWEVNFNMALEPVSVDNVGILTRKLSNLEVTATAIPVGVKPSDVATAMRMQGANSARGMSLAAAGNDLLLSATANNLGCKIFNAAIESAHGIGVFSNRLDRVGPVTWVATRLFSGTGPNPLFSIGNTQVT